jgi:hypothetical protein
MKSNQIGYCYGTKLEEMIRCTSRQLWCSFLVNDGGFPFENSIVHIPDWPDSSDLASSNVWLFGRIKRLLSESTKRFLETLSAEGLKAVFDGQVDHMTHVIANHGISDDPRTSQAESLFLIAFPFL